MGNGPNTLEERVALLERQVAELGRRIPDRVGEEPPELAGNEISMIREARAKQPEIDRAFAEVMAELGIDTTEPVSALEVQEMMLKEGVNPLGNEASREICEMREE